MKRDTLLTLRSPERIKNRYKVLNIGGCIEGNVTPLSKPQNIRKKNKGKYAE
jgi:hypothetical protein